MSTEKDTLLELFDEREAKRKEPDPLNPEGYVKAKVSASFLRDAEQLCLRARTTLEDPKLPIDYGMRSKIFVDILMSFECSLKSLVISLSKNEETPENAYKKARGCSHSVVKLCDEVKVRSYNRLKFVSSKEEDMIQEADDISVHVRYKLDAMKLKAGSHDGRLFSKPNKLLKTIRSREWMDETLGLAFKLKSIAYESGSRYMAQHLFLRGSDVEDANQRLKNFIDQELD